MQTVHTSLPVDDRPFKDIRQSARFLKEDAERWVRDEKALAEVEIAQKAKQAGINLGLLVGSVIAVYTGLILLFLSAAIGVGALLWLTGLNALAAGTIGLFIVSFLVLGGAVAVFFRAKRKLSAAELMPSKTVEALHNLKCWVLSKIQ